MAAVSEQAKANERAQQKRYYEQNRERILAQRKEYQQRTREQRASRQREAYAADPEPQKARSRERSRTNRPAINARLRERYSENPEPFKARRLSAQTRLRFEVLAAYGGRCACCGAGYPPHLTLDHVNGGGRDDRRRQGGGRGVYARLRREGFPPGYQVLCWSCNWAKHHLGACGCQDWKK